MHYEHHILQFLDFPLILLEILWCHKLVCAVIFIDALVFVVQVIGQAEISYLDHLIAHKNILRLDISMDYSVLMQMMQPADKLPRHISQLILIELIIWVRVAECFCVFIPVHDLPTFCVLLNQVKLVAFAALYDFEQLDAVGVVDLFHDGNLALGVLIHVFGVHLAPVVDHDVPPAFQHTLRENFDGDLFFIQLISRQLHFAKRTLAERLRENVLVDALLPRFVLRYLNFRRLLDLALVAGSLSRGYLFL